MFSRTPANQIRIITLNEDEHLQSVLHRVEKGWTFRFVLGPTLMGHRIRLFSSHPVKSDQESALGAFFELSWSLGSRIHNDDLGAFADIVCRQAGAFGYFFLVDHQDVTAPNGSGHFLVAPTLTVGGRPLALDCLQCSTHLSKLLGPFPEWEGRLRVVKESGYNAVHLTPTQTLGHSNSGYSIRDALTFDLRYSTESRIYTYDDVKRLVNKMETEWGMITIQDVVWNHAAKDATWLQDHPECAYNCENSPHLRPAYVLDRIYYHFGREIADDKWKDWGIPKEINSETHLEALRTVLTNEILPKACLADFYQVNIDAICAQFENSVKNLDLDLASNESNEDKKLTIIQDPKYRRFGNSIDMDLAISLFNRPRSDCSSEDSRVRTCTSQLRRVLFQLNAQAGCTAWECCKIGIEAVIGHVRYERVQADGRLYEKVCSFHPLVTSYFLHSGADSDWKDDEHLLSYSDVAQHLLAFNGWVMTDDPLSNFAESPSTVYLCRQLICWSDCVKLRYGDSESDCPFLWQHMRQYTNLCADVFHGIRLDNCHSTPIHVAEYLLEEARKVRPELYVVAELFTGSEQVDNVFVNRLGITSLIREAQSAGDAHEEGRLVFRYGGEPVGAFIQRPTRLLHPAIAHAMFLDVTHDNQCPMQIRTALDLLPTAALVSMASCATGSTRGYDELVPYSINVVSETRLYTSWTENNDGKSPGSVGSDDGILAGKRALNELHFELGVRGFNQVYVDQRSQDIVAVTRHDPLSHQTVVLVARTVFSPDRDNGAFALISPLKIDGKVEEIIFEMKLNKRKPRRMSTTERKVSNRFITGYSEHYSLEIRKNLRLSLSKMTEVHDLNGTGQEIDFNNFPPGSVIAFRVSLSLSARANIEEIRQNLTQFGFRMLPLVGSGAKSFDAKDTGLKGLLFKMSLQGLNRALFRCHEEEQDEGEGEGTYEVPHWGRLNFCGLQGIAPLMNRIRISNDLGHPLCDNLRNGLWLRDYLVDRLRRHPSTEELGAWFQVQLHPLSEIPHYLRPCYFDAVLFGAFTHIREAVWEKMNDFVQGGSDFLRALALASVAFVGHCDSAKLPKLSTKIAPPILYGPPSSFSAGLPHFSCGIWRNWGRDTFIALPGCLLLTGRFNDARYIILAYAGTLRHGLIPNLLGEGVCSRYNCRDSVWFWLLAIRKYVELAPNGLSILTDHVRRIYPQDDAISNDGNEKDEFLHETMYEALQRHFAGISFRERNAGAKIDEHMNDAGFDMEIHVDLDTGFVRGGNEWNCGTWMDKMGSSEKAGNKGRPATPRDGASVELQGLCYAVLEWLVVLKERFPHSSVIHNDQGKKTEWTWNEWANRLRANFEPCFYIGTGTTLDAKYNPKLEMVNRRGIIKDCFGSSAIFTDYQLRSNFLITLAVAPCLLNPQKAWQALSLVEDVLQGPLGMKTLDPNDLAYDGNYDNSDDSYDKKRAKGWNYHQGPEWLWLTGFFLRAKLAIAWRLKQENPEIWSTTVNKTKHHLGGFWMHLQESSWRSLPELTNDNGVKCLGSCPAQAWSIGTILETIADLDFYGKVSVK